MKILGQDWEVDKSLFVDDSNKPRTQSLFLEFNYSDMAVYSLKDDHYTFKGKIYPSIKKLYLEMADPTEYNFATTYLLGWKHWNRIQGNKVLRMHIEEWREELDMKLRYMAHREMIMLVEQEGGNYSAAKWLADRGWDKRAAGRPSKAEKERDRKISERISEEFEADVVRLQDFR